MLETNNFFHATRIVEGYGVLKTVGEECNYYFIRKGLKNESLY